MAIYHFQARMVQRSAGQSAVQTARARGCGSMTSVMVGRDSRSGVTHRVIKLCFYRPAPQSPGATGQYCGTRSKLARSAVMLAWRAR